MKKLLVMLLCFVLCILHPFALAENSQETITSGDYEYVVLEDGTAQITAYHGTTRTIDIPATLDGLRVTSIGDKAFFDKTRRTGVAIPDGVTSIGEDAFYGCPETLTLTITVHGDSYAMEYCQKHGLAYNYPDSLDWLNG